MGRAASGSLRRSGERLTLVDVEPGVCAIGSWQNVIVCVWWSAGTGAAVERLERFMNVLRDKESGRASHIHLLKDRAGIPSPEARAGFIRLMRERTDEIACCAVVVGGTGFWASTMRSAITNMRFLAPRDFELRLHGAASEIPHWLSQTHAQRANNAITEEDLGRVLHDAEEWLLGGFDVAQVSR